MFYSDRVYTPKIPKKASWNGISLPVRVVNFLLNEGCLTIEDAQKIPFSEWLKRRNCSHITAREIISAVNGIDDSKPEVVDVWREFKRTIFYAKGKPDLLSNEEMLAIIAKINQSPDLGCRLVRRTIA